MRAALEREKAEEIEREIAMEEAVQRVIGSTDTPGPLPEGATPGIGVMGLLARTDRSLFDTLPQGSLTRLVATQEALKRTIASAMPNTSALASAAESQEALRSAFSSVVANSSALARVAESQEALQRAFSSAVANSSALARAAESQEALSRAFSSAAASTSAFAQFRQVPGGAGGSSLSFALQIDGSVDDGEWCH